MLEYISFFLMADPCAQSSLFWAVVIYMLHQNEWILIFISASIFTPVM